MGARAPETHLGSRDALRAAFVAVPVGSMGDARISRQHPLTSMPAQLRQTLGLALHQEVVGLAEQYCNDFICTSSPSVEPTVRTLANDVENGVDGKRTERVYSAEVSYKVRALQSKFWHGSRQLALSPQTHQSRDSRVAQVLPAVILPRQQRHLAYSVKGQRVLHFGLSASRRELFFVILKWRRGWYTGHARCQ